MVPADQIVGLALKQTGDDYVFGVEDSPNDRDPDSFDCSELVQWVCARLRVEPTVPDGAYYQWRHCIPITVARAVDTPGALLFVGDGTGVGRAAITHVAISLGTRRTIEARGSRWGVGSWGAIGRFNYAGLIPGVSYAPPPKKPTQPPPHQEDDMTPEQAKMLEEVHAVLVGPKTPFKEILDFSRTAGGVKGTLAKILAKLDQS